MANALPFPPVTGTYNTLVVPVIGAGQNFNDPDLGKLVASLRPGLLDQVEAFYRENSFGLLTTKFSVFGHDVAAPRKPLQLPQSATDYWHPVLEPGGLDFSLSVGDGTVISFDGTENLRLSITPRVRGPVSLDVLFSALSIRSPLHGNFPVKIKIGPMDFLALDVDSGSGGLPYRLNVAFDEREFPLNESSLRSDLAKIEQYLDARIKTATTSLNLPSNAPALLKPVRLRPRGDAAPGTLGTLVLDLSVHPDYGDGTTAITYIGHGGLAGLVGTTEPSTCTLSNTTLGPIELSRLRTYLNERLLLAQQDAGFGSGNRLLNNLALFRVASADPAVIALSLQLRMSELDGGAGSSLTIAAQGRLQKIGFDSPSPVAGRGTKETNGLCKDPDALLDDVFTRLNDALGGGDQTGWFTSGGRDFRCIWILFLGQPPPGTWSADPSGLVPGQRAFRSWRTVKHRTAVPELELQTNWITSVFPQAGVDIGTACHELAHTLGMVQGMQPGGKAVPTDWCLGVPDTYDEYPENQNQLRYFGAWDLMSHHQRAPHLSGYHKRHLGWIPRTRTQYVGSPTPSNPTPSAECWLVPVEHWDPDPGFETKIRAAVGGNLPIRQLIEIQLSESGGRFLLVEARAKGPLFSQSLPFAPGSSAALLVSDGIECSDPQRYVVDFKYRRFVHPLGDGTELDAVNEVFDLAKAPELAQAGSVVRLLGRQDVDGIPVLHAKVEHSPKDSIDLCFTDTNPPWHSTDLWVDWPGDMQRLNPPDGEPYDQEIGRASCRERVL